MKLLNKFMEFMCLGTISRIKYWITCIAIVLIICFMPFLLGGLILGYAATGKSYESLMFVLYSSYLIIIVLFFIWIRVHFQRMNVLKISKKYYFIWSIVFIGLILHTTYLSIAVAIIGEIIISSYLGLKN